MQLVLNCSLRADVEQGRVTVEYSWIYPGGCSTESSTIFMGFGSTTSLRVQERLNNLLVTFMTKLQQLNKQQKEQ